MNRNKYWDFFVHTVGYLYLAIATLALAFKIHDWLPKIINLDVKWLDGNFAKWSGYLLTVIPGIITLCVLVPTLIVWYLAFNNGQVWFWVFYFLNQRDGFLFSVTKAVKRNSSNFEIQKRKIQLAEKKLYNLNGYFKELGLISSVKKAISEPIQFNLRAVKQGNGNYGFSIDSIFQSDNNFTPVGQQTTIKTIGQMLSESSDSVLTLWKPLINNRITGLESYAIQLAVVAEFLDIVISLDQGDVIWEAIYSFYNPNPSTGIDNITERDIKSITKLLVPYFRDNVVKGDFANEMDLLTVPNLSNKIYSTFKTFLTR